VEGSLIMDASDLPVHRAIRLSSQRHAVAVVIPVWNQGQTFLDQLAAMREVNLSCDVIIADGDSSDGSTEPSRLAELGVCWLLVTAERGLGTALRMGIAHALKEGYSAVLTIDGNGKDDFRILPQIVRLVLEDGFDFVQSSRFLPGGHHANTPLGRLLGIKLLIAPLISWASGFRFTDPTNGFKGLSRKFLLDPKLRPFRRKLDRFNFQFYLNIRAPQIGSRVCEIPASRNYPADGSLPTKIHGVRTHLLLIWQLILAAAGWYNPGNPTL
jgi:dolichol-phosphate mannosyltransferase